jgi:hypothetical protein
MREQQLIAGRQRREGQQGRYRHDAIDVERQLFGLAGGRLRLARLFHQ